MSEELPENDDELWEKVKRDDPEIESILASTDVSRATYLSVVRKVDKRMKALYSNKEAVGAMDAAFEAKQRSAS